MPKESIYLKQHKHIIEGVIYTNTATAGGVNTLTDDNISDSYVTDLWNDEILFIYAGTGAGQTRKIETYDQPTHTFTLYDNWITNPDTTSRYQVIAGGGSSGGGGGDATEAKQDIIITDIGVVDGLHDVPTADADTNLYIRDVIGDKTDTARTTVGTTRSIIAYVKGILNQIVDVMGTGFVTADDSLHAISVELTEILDMTRTGADIAVTVTETNLFIDDAPSKIINGISIKIDTTDMGAGDTYEFREYYRIENAGSYIEVADTITLTGAQSDPLYIIPLEPYRYGCKVTAQKTAGTDRAFPIEAIREA